MEETSEAERNKAARPYDGIAELSDAHKQVGAQLLTMAATLEQGYLALRASDKQRVIKSGRSNLEHMHRNWLTDLNAFKDSLHAQGAEPKALKYVDEAFGLLADRIKQRHPFIPQLVGIIDQHKGVVYHHAGQCDHAH